MTNSPSPAAEPRKGRRSPVRDWLTGKVRREARLSFFGAVLLAPLGALVVFVTFWVIYGIIAFGFHWLLPLTHDQRLVAAGVVVALLFVAQAITDRAYLEELHFDTPEYGDIALLMRPVTGFGPVWLTMGPQTARSLVKVLVMLLLVGPGMMATAWRLLRRGLRLWRMDVEGCGRILSLLLREQRRVPLSVIFEHFPHLSPYRILPQLREIEGVVFLLSDPPGLTLAPLLVEEITEFRRRAT